MSPPLSNKQPPRKSSAKILSVWLTRLARLFSTLIKAIIIILGLLALQLSMVKITQQSQSFVVSTWQRLSLMQQELPQDNSLPSPLPGRHLTDTWGSARSEGRSHEGIDIFAPRGTPIQATTQGIVRLAMIDWADGWWSSSAQAVLVTITLIWNLMPRLVLMTGLVLAMSSAMLAIVVMLKARRPMYIMVFISMVAPSIPIRYYKSRNKP